ncbi:ankyrin repeat-containing domain protein [Emericellopsis atlantica]|uniref:Ankyrin repeat-containing domain protein n=1 Tax=Emericellopsis atlantica TaxID=2614577 RepID=A0A9P7ZLI5_9HYPO|nr:ankyrin repeat-containing domain protein [Emericellopsis atlantica]KAG9254215.1 ankyrin repeat-containing domain protein [Emericellopsis atlantica]
MDSDALRPLTLEALPPELIQDIAAKCEPDTWQIDVNSLARTSRYLHHCVNAQLYRYNYRIGRDPYTGGPEHAQDWALRMNRLSTFVRTYELGIRVDKPHYLFLNAVENHDIAIIEYLLSTKDVDIKQRDDYGYPALYWAVGPHKSTSGGLPRQTVELLIARGAEVDAPDLGIDKLPMGRACMYGDIDIVKLLLANGANVNPPTEDTVDTGSRVDSERYGYGPLHYAADFNHVEVIRLLLDHGAKIESAYSDTTCTPLWVAAGAGNLASTRFLLQAGAKANPRGTGLSPLEHLFSSLNEGQNAWPPQAPYFFHSSCVFALLEAGALPNTRLLDRALAQKLSEIACGLVKYGVDLSSQEPWLLSEILRTHPWDCSALIRTLVGKGFDCNMRHPEVGLAPIHIAAYRNDTQAIRVLLKLGADIEQRDDLGRTPLRCAISTRFERPSATEAIELLLKRGSDPLAPDRRLKTPLHAAAHLGDVATMKLLLESDMFGDDLSPRDHSGKTPIFYAAENGNYEVLKLLLENGRSAECYQLRGHMDGDQPCNNHEDEDGCTPLIAAARHVGDNNDNDLRSVEILLRANPTEFDAKDPSGYGLLDIRPGNKRLEDIINELAQQSKRSGKEAIERSRH